ncbi:MAG: ParB N-terminal domain-containing protein [Solirubrobacteraceae bacterium]
MPPDTGFPLADAQDDFLRARRRQSLSRLAQRLRRAPDDVNLILPFEEVVAALGQTGERPIGLQTIPLDSIVGTVDRTSEFDRKFRPTSARVRSRWERVDNAQRRGTPMPPISVYRIGDLHFVRDGHHRVSVARARGLGDIEAQVVEVTTRLKPTGELTLADLPLKSHERVFLERVPLSEEQAERVRLSETSHYDTLAEGVEAWGFRRAQERGCFMDRAEVAAAWFTDEYEPVVTMLREAEMLGSGPEAEAYLRVARERYRLLRTHGWSDEIIARLRAAMD